MIRRLLSYHLAIVMLVTNIGIPVFTHVCHGQGKSWSSAFVPAKSCCSRSKNNKAEGICHIPGKESQGLSFNARPCCENHAGFVQFQPDILISGAGLLLKGVDKFLASPLSYPEVRISGVSLSMREATRSHGPPRTLHGRSMLIFQQVFRC